MEPTQKIKLDKWLDSHPFNPRYGKAYQTPIAFYRSCSGEWKPWPVRKSNVTSKLEAPKTPKTPDNIRSLQEKPNSSDAWLLDRPDLPDIRRKLFDDVTVTTGKLEEEEGLPETTISYLQQLIHASKTS